MESITLYYKQGSSDKVYQARIEPKEGGFVVNFVFGRRGTTLSAGTKTSRPVNLDAAKTIYDKLVREKMAKGYSPGESGTPYQDTDKASASTGIHCQLLNSIDAGQVGKLIDDPDWWMQEKHDGRRLLIRKQGDTIIGINRLGLAVALPGTLVADAGQCPEDFIIDGEAVGDDLYAFDVLLVGLENIGVLRYGERHPRLVKLLGSFPNRHIHLTTTASTIEDKHALYQRLKDGQAEGAVFKDTNAPYMAGRPASGGPQLKFKFVENASFVVAKVNDKRSIALKLFNGEEWLPAGNVTIPPNQAIPVEESVVECRYLYAFRESGCIYQPVYLGVRDDIPADECVTGQLKFKAG
jgi:bifunctional non-homologous end joining protein LigD